MEKDLRKKIAGYSSVAAAMIASGNVAHAQNGITYTAANDTLTATDPIGLIDLDQDGNPDFAVTLYTSSSAGDQLRIVLGGPYGAQGNAVAGSVPSSYNYPFKLNNGDIIGTGLNFLPSGGSYGFGTMAFWVNGSNPYSSFWNGGVTDGYLGLRLDTVANSYYGWARIDIAADNSMVVIKDFAVSTNPGASINAGQNGLSVERQKFADARIWAGGDHLNVVLPAGFTTGNITLVNMAGQKVNEYKVEGHSERFNISSLPTGVYIATLRSDNHYTTRKVVVN